MEVKSASLAGQSTERSQSLPLFGLNQCRIALVAAVQRSDHPALFCLLNPFPAQVSDGFVLLRAGERLSNGLGHRVATLGIGGKFVPHPFLRLAAAREPAFASLG